MKSRICAAAALAIAGCAAAQAQTVPPTPAPACLEPIRLYDWNAMDNRTVIVTDRMRKKFKVSLAPGCYDLKFAFRLGFKSFSTSRLSCIGRGDSVLAPSGTGMPRQTCLIEKVEAYTPDMAHADAVAKAMNSPH